MIDFDKFVCKTEDEMLFDKYKKKFNKFDDEIIHTLVKLSKEKEEKEKEIIFVNPLFTLEKKDITITFD